MVFFTFWRTSTEIQLVHVHKKFAEGGTLTRREAKTMDRKEKFVRAAGGDDHPVHRCDACLGFPGPLCDDCYQRRHGPLRPIPALLPLVARGAWRRRVALALRPGRLNAQGAQSLLVAYQCGTEGKFAREWALRGKERRPLRAVSRRGAERAFARDFAGGAGRGAERATSSGLGGGAARGARPKLKAVNLRRPSTRQSQARRRDRRRQSRSSDWVDAPDERKKRRPMVSVSTAAATRSRPAATEGNRSTERREPQRQSPVMAGALDAPAEGSPRPELTGPTPAQPAAAHEGRGPDPHPEQARPAHERHAASDSFLWRRRARILSAGTPIVAAQLFRMPGREQVMSGLGRSASPSRSWIPRRLSGAMNARREMRSLAPRTTMILPTPIPPTIPIT